MSKLSPQHDPIKISYSDDEVKKFHPLVEEKLKDYMKKNNLDSKYALEHHPTTIVGTIPDFVIIQKNTGRWVYVIEVKRTPSNVRSVSTWDQARSYVTNNKIKWARMSKPYFMATNIELTYFLCDRTNEPTQFCLLKKGEKSCSEFGTDATNTLKDFETRVLPRIFDDLNKQNEEYSDNLKIILDEFSSLQEELSSYISKNIQPKMDINPQKFGFDDAQEYCNKMDKWKFLNDPGSRKVDYKKIAREIARDSLLRIFIYEYCRELFKAEQINSSLKPIITKSQSNMETSIKLALQDLGKIDFVQIIKTRVVNFVPENMDGSTFKYLEEFLEKIHRSMGSAIKENGTTAYLLNIIMRNNKFYSWKEANGNGKIMTDPELADLASFLCFKISNNSTPSIFDPGVGTGNLLSTCYDRLKSANPELSHNKILSQLHGREMDVFLGKLGVFNLIMRSPLEITNNTKIDIRLEDFFETVKSDIKKHDIVIMNPPFLRNDNKVAKLSREIIEEKIKKTQGEKSIMALSSQPNLFYYFVELATKVIKNNGVGCYFMMSSVLNTLNGQHLKQFLLDNFEIKYIIKCPRIFFGEYLVSPCIVVGKRKNNPSSKNVVKFVRIHTFNFFNSDYSELAIDQDISNGELKISCVYQKDLKAKDKWKRHLLPIPPFYDIFHSSNKFLPLKKIFGKVIRGELANEGNGSSFFFPWSNSSAKKRLGADVINDIENQFKQYGLNNSKTPKHYILSDSDLTKEQCLSIKKDVTISKHPGLAMFINTFDEKYTKPKKWHIDDMTSKAQLIIPRATRRTHAVFLNPYWNTKNVYLSTNFVCFSDCNKIEGVSVHSILGFVAGFLNSSFGQIMFEIESQDMEGLRKIERGVIAEKIFVPIKDLSSSKEEMKRINDAFLMLNYGITGMDDDKTRDRLDLVTAEILWKHEPAFQHFAASPENLANLAKEFLRELVRDRHEI